MTTIRRILAIAWEKLHDHGSPGIAGCSSCGRPEVAYLLADGRQGVAYETTCRLCGPRGREVIWRFDNPLRWWGEAEFEPLAQSLFGHAEEDSNPA